VPSTIIAIASSRSVMEEDEDQAVLDAALAAAGCERRLWSWDDPDVDWSAASAVVIRSTWDYATRREEFCRWADDVAASVPLFNGAEVVRWNTDKRYLAELEAVGIAVAPTVWLTPGDAVVLPSADEVVVKPAVSAGAKDTTRHDLRRNSVAAVEAATVLLEAGRTVMVQPYLASVDTDGETGLVYVVDRFHHAFRKGQILKVGGDATDRLYAPEAITPAVPSGGQLRLAEAVLDALPFDRTDLLYARVDTAAGPDGDPLLMELELVEPSLFFKVCGQSAEALVAGLVARLAA
jgi:hypothetical protein